MLRTTGKRPMMSCVSRHYDVCVIGGGPAGISAALRAVDYKKRVCLIEKDRVGGADLWDGALQSKTMWEMAKFSSRLRTLGHRLYPSTELERYKNVSDDQIRSTLLLASEKRERQMMQALSAAQVDIFRGKGSFRSPHHVQIDYPENTPSKTRVAPASSVCNITADYFLIATGSKPRPHPMIVADEQTIVTSDSIMQHDLPESLVVIGAGIIGCEFASIYANFGKTKVSIIEKADRILPMEDADIAIFVQELLRNRGVRFHHKSALESMEIVQPGEESKAVAAAPKQEVDRLPGTKQPYVRYSVKSNADGSVESFDVAKALISIGRVPYFGGLGLENTNVALRRDLDVDGYGRCKPHDHIYACGDATVDIALVNKGEYEAVTAIDHMYSQRPCATSSVDNLSTIMFLDEEVASVGLNEQQCRKKNIAYRVAKYGYEYLARALCMGTEDGFVKILVTNDDRMTVLGVRAVGAQASTVAELASLAIHRRTSAFDLQDLLAAYPAVTQGFQECIRLLIGKSLLKKGVFSAIQLEEWSPNHYNRGGLYQSQEEDKEKKRLEKKKKSTEEAKTEKPTSA